MSPSSPENVPSFKTDSVKKDRDYKSSVEDPSAFLNSWVTHSDESFHNFTSEEARAIRRALLIWYRENRRKLPWRGDPPPYDGSTAGYSGNNNDKYKKSKKNAVNKQAGSIKNYFKPKESSQSDENNGKKNAIVNHSNELKQKETEKNKSKPVSAYGVWVSEIMLQQTRVEAVIPYYIKWMKSFPTVNCLADATEEEVNSHWAGLGFYRRARYLHKGAKQVVEFHNGTLPSTVKELLTIDGIGPYTAGAIASIAYNQSVPLVDGNVCRVLARLKGIANHIKAPVLKDDIGWKLAAQIVNAGDHDGELNYGSAGEINQALMELGATYCSPSGSGMEDEDPLKEFYLSTKISKCIAQSMMKHDQGENNIEQNSFRQSILNTLEKAESMQAIKGARCKACDPDGISMVLEQVMADLDENRDKLNSYKIGSIGHGAIPIPPPKKKKKEEVLVIAAFCDNEQRSRKRKNGASKNKEEERWLLVQRPSKGLLAGQWEFPAVCVWASTDNDNASKSKNSKSSMVKRKKAEGPNKQKTEVPFIESEIREKELTKFLEKVLFKPSDIPKNDTFMKNKNSTLVLQNFCSVPRTTVGSDPLEHIFSHVRHTMWVEYARLSYPSSLPSSWFVASNVNTSKSDIRQVRWMSEADMKTVGITSGVKKILSAVKMEREKQHY